jgi:hypothetical protein
MARDSILEVKAGELVKRCDYPLDLRGRCADRFDDWPELEHGGAQTDMKAIPEVEAPQPISQGSY